METISPRAATGTLDEPIPVAAFTTPLGLMLGVGCPTSEGARQKKHVSSARQLAR
jgi:hypothetical protein